MWTKQQIIRYFLVGLVAIPCICNADELTLKLRSYVEGRLAQNPVMIREQELYKLAEANFMLKLADKVEKGEINQETFDLALKYLELWSAKR